MGNQQACKPRSYASSQLRTTDRLSGVECSATSVAKNIEILFLLLRAALTDEIQSFL